MFVIPNHVSHVDGVSADACFKTRSRACDFARGHNHGVRVSAKVDYALRALAELAQAESEQRSPMRREDIARAQGIPRDFLENILRELKGVGIVASVRGNKGGFRLGRPAQEIPLAEVIRVLEGPLASVRGIRPDYLEYAGPAESLRDVWLAVRTSLRDVLDTLTVADVAGNRLPPRIARKAVADPER